MSPPDLAFEMHNDAGDAALAVSGELDLATGTSLEEAALTLLSDRPSVLALDLGELRFCDSSGIACLIHIRKAAVAAGSRLQLRNVHGRVRHVLELAGVSDILGVQPES